MFLDLNDRTAEPQFGVGNAATDSKVDKELSTMDKVIIASVVVSAVGVLVQIWSLSNQAQLARLAHKGSKR